MEFRILVVEDSRTQAEALRMLLEEESYSVTVVGSGEEALEWIAGNTADLVLSDIMMPGITGYELCQRIKADPAYAELPVVLLTTLGDPMDIVRGLECGANNYITKPFDPQHLLARVRRVLDNRSLRSGAKTTMGVNIAFLGSIFTITSEREQILDLLLSSVEDVLRTNRALEQSQRQLAEAHAKLESYASTKEREAQVSTERYRALMQNAADAIFVLRPDGTILEANPRAGDLLDRPLESLLHQPIQDFAAAGGRTDAGDLLDAWLTEGGTKSSEMQMVGRSGRRIDVEFSASLTSLDGESLVLVIVRDITARRQAEEALHRSEEQLRQAQKMEVVGRLAGGIAHDFNNLLTAIKSNAYFVLSDLPEDDPLREDVLEIDRAVDRAAALTHQLLAFSRKQLLKPQVVRLSETVSEMEKMLRRVIGEHIDLVTSADAELGCIAIDPVQLEQVLLNLAINARDAMPTGGRLAIEVRDTVIGEGEGEFFPYLAAGTPAVVLSVSDTGHGIPKELQEQIFEPFFTTKEAGKGTGLGLSTVYGIVKQSRGYIWVESQPGEGTTFKIYFPRVENEPEEVVPAEDPAATSSRGTESILLVEDEPSIRLVVRRTLQKQGYSVLEASNGVEALHIFEQNRGEVKLLITDVVMPVMSGRELAERVSALDPSTRVLFISGYSEEMIANQGILERGVALIQKPFTPEDLTRRVRGMLEGEPVGSAR